MIFSLSTSMLLFDFYIIYIKKPSICSTDGFFDFSSSSFTTMKDVNNYDDNDDYFRL